ncbi:MAG: thiol peroxidase [Sedimentisphaerales bacterium]|nr:thiol peroxidase [Sedimentisphaerales bacterium]
MPIRQNAVTMKGNPINLVGPTLQVGDPAPDAVLTANDLSEKKLSEYFGKVCILTSVPSLDTPVCDAETRRFNQEVAKLSPDAVVLTVSMDLPFAQKRWCGSANVERVITLSDYRHREFGQNYGVLIEGLGLLARAVFVVDAQGVIRYVELVSEVTSEPRYDDALQAARQLL